MNDGENVRKENVPITFLLHILFLFLNMLSIIIRFIS